MNEGGYSGEVSPNQGKTKKNEKRIIKKRKETKTNKKKKEERKKEKTKRKKSRKNIFLDEGAFFCSTSLSRGNQVGGLPRALIELVGQMGGSATIDDILKKMKENVIHGR
ncbi:MAG: hypothetical protein QGI86_28450 [Candidatus Poribacteria bacterium]|nr:hypothetical protein [Candidatus Poribacteria bacterium]